MTEREVELEIVLGELVTCVEGYCFPFGQCTMKSRERIWEVFVRACKILEIDPHRGIFRPGWPDNPVPDDERTVPRPPILPE